MGNGPRIRKTLQEVVNAFMDMDVDSDAFLPWYQDEISDTSKGMSQNMRALLTFIIFWIVVRVGTQFLTQSYVWTYLRNI